MSDKSMSDKPMPAKPAPAPLDEAALAQLDALLDELPPPLQPLGLSALDGYLCGVLVQPQRPPLSRWWPFVLDVEGRPAPETPAVKTLQALVLRRHAELDRAIEQRDWFDPWVLGEGQTDEAAADDSLAEQPAEERGPDTGTSTDTDTDTDTGDDDNDDDVDDAADASLDAVLPWISGFAAAMEHFPKLMLMPDPALMEPLALLFLHFDAEDLEDADTLLATIEGIEPPGDLAEAVQDIVRALMLMADVTRPRLVQKAAAKASRRGHASRSGGRTPPPRPGGPGPRRR